MANLSIGNDVIGPDKIDIVYFFPRNELINLIVRVDSSVFKFSLGNLKVCVGIDLDAKPLPPDKAASAEDRAAAPGRRPGRSERPAPRPSTAWSDGRPADSRPCPASRPRTGFPCRTPWNRPPWRRNGFAVDEHSRRHRSPASAPAFAIGWATSLTSSEKFPKRRWRATPSSGTVAQMAHLIRRPFRLRIFRAWSDTGQTIWNRRP
jgi:hypothetical protein